LYYQATEAGEPRLLLDPAGLAEAGGPVYLADFAPSWDGRWVAYGLSGEGQSAETWKVMQVESGQGTADEVRGVQLSNTVWTRDGTGFFYSRFTARSEGDTGGGGFDQLHQLWFHRLGTLQEQDRLVFQRPERPAWNYYPQVSEDGRFLVVTVSEGTSAASGVFLVRLDEQPWVVEDLLPEFDAAYSFVGGDGDNLFFLTDAGAPLGKLVAVDVSKGHKAVVSEVVPPGEHRLEGATLAGKRLYLRYLENVTSQLRMVDLHGQLLGYVQMPEMGSLGGGGGASGSEAIYFSFSSFVTPPTVYRYDPAAQAAVVWFTPSLPVDSARYETRQVLVRSRDGTSLPMFICHRKDVVMDGERPTLLYGFGGFGVSMKPRFDVAPLVWMELGGVYAVPALRGGGEFGEGWHQGGMGRNKQNTFDDCIAAAEWLVANDVTNPRRLAIAGGSNGGLLVGACMTQRPGLFGVALPSVGVFDMLRFPEFTIGWAWVSEYGDVKEPGMLEVLRSYSPLHQVRPGVVYPSTLIATPAHDRRVVPGHSFKFAAALQAHHVGDNPILLRVQDEGAPLGVGRLDPQLEEAADQWAFAFHEMRFVPGF
jgi:prolyl oligopeptidase